MEVADDFVKQRRIGVEEHENAARLQMRDHARQVFVQQRLADAVQPEATSTER